jgi:hypothetical protein
MIADHPDRHRYILDVDGHQAAEVVYRMIPTCDYLQGWLRKHPDLFGAGGGSADAVWPDHSMSPAAIGLNSRLRAPPLLP